MPILSDESRTGGPWPPIKPNLGSFHSDAQSGSNGKSGNLYHRNMQHERFLSRHKPHALHLKPLGCAGLSGSRPGFQRQDLHPGLGLSVAQSLNMPEGLTSEPAFCLSARWCKFRSIASHLHPRLQTMERPPRPMSPTSNASTLKQE